MAQPSSLGVRRVRCIQICLSREQHDLTGVEGNLEEVLECVPYYHACAEQQDPEEGVGCVTLVSWHDV